MSNKKDSHSADESPESSSFSEPPLSCRSTFGQLIKMEGVLEEFKNVLPLELTLKEFCKLTDEDFKTKYSIPEEKRKKLFIVMQVAKAFVMTEWFSEIRSPNSSKILNEFCKTVLCRSTTDSEALHIDVKDMEKPVIDNKSITGRTCKVGENVVFEIFYKGFPVPTAFWSKNGRKIKETDRRISFEVQEEKVVFGITDAFRDDTGIFKLVLRNNLGSDCCFIEVDIKSRPSPPIQVKATVYNMDSIKLEWKEPLEKGGLVIRNYIIQRKNISSKTWNILSSYVLPTTFVDKKIVCGHTYIYRLLAQNDMGIGDPSVSSAPVKLNFNKWIPGSILKSYQMKQIYYERGQVTYNVIGGLRRFAITTDKTVIGSHEECDIILSGPLCKTEYYEIHFDKTEQAFIVPKDEVAIRLNKKLVLEKKKLSHGDCINMDGISLWFNYPPWSSLHKMAKKYRDRDLPKVIKLQRAIKAWRERKIFLQMQKSAIVIQKSWRKYVQKKNHCNEFSLKTEYAEEFQKTTDHCDYEFEVKCYILEGKNSFLERIIEEKEKNIDFLTKKYCKDIKSLEEDNKNMKQELADTIKKLEELVTVLEKTVEEKEMQIVLLEQKIECLTNEIYIISEEKINLKDQLEGVFKNENAEAKVEYQKTSEDHSKYEFEVKCSILEEKNSFLERIIKEKEKNIDFLVSETKKNCKDIKSLEEDNKNMKQELADTIKEFQVKRCILEEKVTFLQRMLDEKEKKISFLNSESERYITDVKTLEEEKEHLKQELEDKMLQNVPTCRNNANEESYSKQLGYVALALATFYIMKCLFTSKK